MPGLVGRLPAWESIRNGGLDCCCPLPGLAAPRSPLKPSAMVLCHLGLLNASWSLLSFSGNRGLVICIASGRNGDSYNTPSFSHVMVFHFVNIE